MLSITGCRNRKKIAHHHYDLGLLPNSFISHEIFLFAENFALKIDRIGACLKALKKIAGAVIDTPKFDGALTLFENTFQYATDIRDAVSHPENRVRQKDRKGNKITGDVDTSGMFDGQPASVFYTSCLQGDNITFTNEQGEHANMPVTSGSLESLEGIVQTCIECLSYRGHFKDWFPKI